MNLATLITDNISEILVKIIEFTQARQKILVQNLTSLHIPGFIPQELEVDEFSDLLNNAINEHIRTERLVLCDTENIKFGFNGSFIIKPVTDEISKEVLDENQDEYIKQQIDKLWENSLNLKLAAELLRQKQEMAPSNYSIFE